MAGTKAGLSNEFQRCILGKLQVAHRLDLVHQPAHYLARVPGQRADVQVDDVGPDEIVRSGELEETARKFRAFLDALRWG